MSYNNSYVRICLYSYFVVNLPPKRSLQRVTSSTEAILPAVLIAYLTVLSYKNLIFFYKKFKIKVYGCNLNYSTI